VSGNYYKGLNWTLIQVNLLVVRHPIHCLKGVDAASGSWVAAVEAEIAVLFSSGNQQLTDNNHNAGYTIELAWKGCEPYMVFKDFFVLKKR
jgi:hypothetical protein